MNNTPHTAPGPYRAEGQSIKAISHGSWFTIARVENKRLTPKAKQDTAVLLAAAPDLLAALKLFLQFFDEMPKGQLGRIVCDIGLLNDAFIESRKAVNNAENAP